MSEEAKIQDTFQMNVLCCARCGGDHMNALARRFIGSEPLPYTHWIACPVTQHPILVRFEEVDDDE